ncbi:MAG: hypothetical protein JOZ56_10680 [Actinobacteria bacterium]|nr:hypothetical protein [Actinomycetota bacterium]
MKAPTGYGQGKVIVQLIAWANPSRTTTVALNLGSASAGGSGGSSGGSGGSSGSGGSNTSGGSSTSNGSGGGKLLPACKKGKYSTKKHPCKPKPLKTKR